MQDKLPGELQEESAPSIHVCVPFPHALLQATVSPFATSIPSAVMQESPEPPSSPPPQMLGTSHTHEQPLASQAQLSPAPQAPLSTSPSQSVSWPSQISGSGWPMHGLNSPVEQFLLPMQPLSTPSGTHNVVASSVCATSEHEQIPEEGKHRCPLLVPPQTLSSGQSSISVQAARQKEPRLPIGVHRISPSTPPVP